MNVARHHTDLAHSDATPIGTEGLNGYDFDGVPAHDACDPRHDTTVVIWPGRDSDGQPRVLSRQAEDVSYMAPEMVAAKLRALYKEPHYCRSVGCENVVDHCGDHCPRCTSEIEALRKDYAEKARKARRTFKRSAGWITFLIVALFLAVFAVKWVLG